jgi:hypothetical protein
MYVGFSVFVCLATSWSPVQEVLPTVPDQETEETQPYAPKAGASSQEGGSNEEQKKIYI